MTTIRLKQELHSVTHTLWSCLVLALVLGGIGGTIYKVISPDGWVAQAFGRSLSAGVAALGSMGLVGSACLVLARSGRPGERPRLMFRAVRIRCGRYPLSAAALD